MSKNTMTSFVIIALFTILPGCSDFSSGSDNKPADISKKMNDPEGSGGASASDKAATNEAESMDITDDTGLLVKTNEELPSRNLNTRDLEKIFAIPLNCDTRDNLVFPDGTVACYSATSLAGEFYDIAWLKEGKIISTYRAPERISILFGKIINDDTFAIMGYDHSNGKFLQFFNRKHDTCKVSLGAIQNHTPPFIVANDSVVITEFIGKLLPDTSVSWFRNCERVAQYTRQLVSRDGHPAPAMSAPVAMPDGGIVVESVENVDGDMNSFRHKLLWLKEGQLDHEVQFIGHSRDKLMTPGENHQSVAFFESNGGYYSWYRNGVFESQFYLHHIVSKALPLRFENDLQLVDEGSNTLFILDPTGEKCRQTIRFGHFGGMHDAKYRQLPDGTTVIISSGGEAIWTKDCNTVARIVIGEESGQYRPASEIFPDGSFIIYSNSRYGWRWVRDGVILADFNVSNGMAPIYVEKDTVLMQDPDAWMGMAWVRLRQN